DIIPAGTYEGVGEIETLSIGMQWVVAEALDADLVYELLRALWHPQNRKILDAGPAMAQKIRLGTAVLGVATPPLHAGAERYYRELPLISSGSGLRQRILPGRRRNPFLHRGRGVDCLDIGGRNRVQSDAIGAEARG